MFSSEEISNLAILVTHQMGIQGRHAQGRMTGRRLNLDHISTSMQSMTNERVTTVMYRYFAAPFLPKARTARLEPLASVPAVDLVSKAIAVLRTKK